MKNEQAFSQVIKYLFIGLFLIITFLLLVMSPSLDYPGKKSFLAPNSILLFFDILVVVIIYMIWKVLGGRRLNIDLYGSKLIITGTVILFFAQVYVSYNIYFLTGWDVGGYIIPAARDIASGMPLDAYNDYFSRYPNNIILVSFFSILFKLNTNFGILDTDIGVMTLITFNCLISSLSGFLTYKTVEKLANKRWAMMAWIVFVLLIGTSPWIVITYSDSLALFLPILIFFLYIRDWAGNYYFLRWFLIGVLSFIGYYIKPQVILILIAIIIMEIIAFLRIMNRKKGLLLILVLCLSFLLSCISYKAIYQHSGFNINKESTFGITHFAMMGLNPQRGGVYSDEDVEFSASFETASERNKAAIEQIKSRLRQLGVFGYTKFLSKKVLVNYGDGTFAWSGEGHFYNETFPDKNQWMSPTLKSYYYSTGSNYGKTSTVEQMIWVGVIFFMLGVVWIKKQQLDKRIVVLMLTIIGLTVFELLFEARARYLYIYAPIYISLSIIGLQHILNRVKKLKWFS